MEAPIASRTTSARPKRARGGDEAYCPHCFLLVADDADGSWPPGPSRCPHCRLMIGPGRARPSPEANPGARGTAAGVFAHRAKHTASDYDDASPDAVRKAIRSVAEELGSRPERLLMVDYQQKAVVNESLPDLDDVFAAFGSWKQARRAAAEGTGGRSSGRSNGRSNGAKR